MKMRVADYIFKRVPELTGSKHCFFVAGGGIMHLCDGLGKSKVTPVPVHHEQAAAISADAYGRTKNTIGVVLATTGPGGTNTLTGVSGAWLDSSPLLVITGQSSRANWQGKTGVRQMGLQETDVVAMAKPVTKYAVTIGDPQMIRYHLEKAIYLARHGRPGPVWLDIHLDVQGAVIETKNLKPFDPKEIEFVAESLAETKKKVREVVKLLKKAKRPLIFGGHGVWLSGGKKEFRQLVNQSGIPFQLSWNGADLIEEDHRLNFGRPSVFGSRYPGLILQNADLIISIGSRLSLIQIGYNYQSFARGAKLVMVDLDEAELKKYTLNVDLPIRADAKVFMELLLAEMKKKSFQKPDTKAWVDWCRARKQAFPLVTKEHRAEKRYVDPYVFVEAFSDLIPEGAAIVPASSGSFFTVVIQSFKVKKNQRFFINKGHMAMGYGLPSVVGASFAIDRGPVYSLAGDGGIQMNIQELQTIVTHKLPVKMFVLNNKGYYSIRVTQSGYFKGRYVGSCCSEGRIDWPSLEKLAKAYGIGYAKISKPTNLRSQIKKVFDRKGPVLCEVMANPKPTTLLPKLASYKLADGSMASRPIEDMKPILPREELKKHMLIDLWPGTEED